MTNRAENPLGRGAMKGVRFSRGAFTIIQRAVDAGIDPTNIIEKAASAARSEGRNKVGMFGKSGEQLDYLREVVSHTVFERSKQF